jgi:hypothetical protein
MPRNDFTALARSAAQSKYWREQDAELVLSAWEASGRSLASFAREWGINRARLSRWRQLLADRAASTSPSATFHPVHVLAAEDGPTAAGLELVLANGRRIIVPRGFDEGTLERLLRLAETTC